MNTAISFIAVETPSPDTFAGENRQDSNVRYVEPAGMAYPLDDGAGPLYTPNDPRYAEQYAPGEIRAPAAWDWTRGSTDASVCIVDSGVRSTHQDLQSRWRGGRDFVENDDTPQDDNGHGTHVAGIAAATIGNSVGIAGMGNVAFYTPKVFGATGGAPWDRVASAITWCADRGSRVVISMSLGGSTGSDTLQNAVRYASRDRGALLVAAAGNDGPCTDCVNYPAKYPEVVAVTCTGRLGTPCTFSSTGPEAELSAPGDSILSTCHGSDSDYCSKSGTSMSAPHVSGAATLLWSYDTSLRSHDIRSRLRESSQDLGAPGRDETFGWGELDARCLFEGHTLNCIRTQGIPPLANGDECQTPGPDSFGYTCRLTAFQWRDAAKSGTQFTLGDDQTTGAIPIGFPFRFYGRVYTEMTISSNGFIEFVPPLGSTSGDSGCCQAQAIPDSWSPNRLVAGYWEDLYPPGGGAMHYQTFGIAPFRHFVVQWVNVPHFGGGRESTFQIVLFEENGAIETQLFDVKSNAFDVHVTGIEDGTGTVGLRYNYGAYEEWERGIVFRPPV